MSNNLASNLKFFVSEETDGKFARLPVFEWLRSYAANSPRSRAWGGLNRIASDTGFGKPRVSAALDWLQAHGAIYLVPNSMRIGDERETRSHVWQLTGLIHLNDKLVRYNPIPDSNLNGLLDEIAHFGKMLVFDPVIFKTELPKLDLDDLPQDGEPLPDDIMNAIKAFHNAFPFPKDELPKVYEAMTDLRNNFGMGWQRIADAIEKTRTKSPTHPLSYLSTIVMDWHQKPPRKTRSQSPSPAEDTKTIRVNVDGQKLIVPDFSSLKGKTDAAH